MNDKKEYLKPYIGFMNMMMLKEEGNIGENLSKEYQKKVRQEVNAFIKNKKRKQ